MPSTNTNPGPGRAGLFALLVLLSLVAALYARYAPGHPAVMIVLIVGTTLALAAPALAIAVTLAMAPIIDGLVALIYGAQPFEFQDLGLALTEPAFLGVTAGFVIREMWRRDETGGPHWGDAARFYVLSMLAVLAVSLAPYLIDWQVRSGYVFRSMWRALPGLATGAREDLIRDGLLLLAAPLWLHVVRTSVRTERRLRQVRLAWLVGGLVVAAYGYRMWMRGEGPSASRIPSVLDDVNSYGSYLVLTVFMSIAVLSDDRRWVARVLAGVSLAATMLMLIPAGSRVAVLAVLGAGTVLAMLAIPRRRWVVASVAIALTLTTVVSLRVSGLADQTHPTIRLVRNSTDPARVASYFVEMRQAMWSAAARAFIKAPLTGIGPGRLYASLGDYYRPEDPGYRPPNENAHNYFLQLAAETGLVGVLAFVVLLASVLAPAFRDQIQGLTAPRILAIGAIGYLATCLSGHPLLISRQVLLFWGYLGLLGVSSPRHDPARPIGARVVRWSTWALVPVVLAAILIGPPESPCPAAAGVSVAYGVGFYPADSTSTGAWRWMGDVGELRLCNNTGSVAIVDIAVPAASIAVPRSISVYISGRRVLRDTVRSEQTLTLSSVSLPPGWSAVSLVPDPGPRPVDPIVHNGDRRRISVRIGDPSISVRPAR